MSYAIGGNEVSLADRKTFLSTAIENGIARAMSKLGVGRGELVVREAHPGTDFAAAYGAGVEYYVTTAPAAAGWLAVGSVGAAVFAVLPVGAMAVFYKIYDAAGIPLCTAVRFRVGGTGATTKASFFIQGIIDTKMEPEVWLSEPVIYDPFDTLFIQWYARALGAAEELSFGCFIIEKVGATVS
jgi:hypothetical protein